jgi:hypothetical protein
LWLEYEEVQTKPQIDQDLFLIDLAERGIGTPEQPEPLTTLRKLRRFNFSSLYYSGGLSNQPHIWLDEINAAIDGEIEHERITLINLKLKQQAAEEESNATPKQRTW